MEFKLEDFFPLYPESLSNNSKTRFEIGSLDVINTLKEFTDNRLDAIEILPTKPGEATKHQIVIRRLLSGYTQFDALLLVHEMGTGKTCSAIQAIEQNLIESNNGLFLRAVQTTDFSLQTWAKPQGKAEDFSFNKNCNNNYGPGLDGAVVLTRGKTLMNNFMDELVNRCSTNYSSGNRNEISKTSKKLFSKFYSFYTFEIFAKTVKKMRSSEIVKKFDNKIIVIDEAHNLRLSDVKVNDEKIDVYGEVHRFIHLLTNKKVLLLTGTPMKDGPQEIASLMNLILPLTQQMPTNKNFLKEYFPSTEAPQETYELGDEEEFLKSGGEEMKNIKKFKAQVYGCVSFLKAMDSKVLKVMVGERMGSLKHYKVVAEYMSTFQSKAYVSAYLQDKRERGIYNNSRQASRFVFPDGTYGAEGFQNYIIEKRGRGGKIFRLSPSLRKEIEKRSSFKSVHTLTDEQKEFVYLQNINEYSAEYAYIIKSILNATRNGELSIVYNDSVRGSGLIVLTLLLELFGFARNNGTAKMKKSYGIFSNETTSVREIRALQKIFNSDENMNGNIMPVIFGSRVIAEGLTFKNVIHEHVVPHWNGSETEQVIARGWRLGSHEALIKKWEQNGQVGKKPQLNVYRHVVIPSSLLSSEVSRRETNDLSLLNNSVTALSFSRGIMENMEIKSIDLIMYEVSEKKDIAISKVLRCLKEVAIDCQLFKKRNEKDSSFDYKRECEYEKCLYVCDDNGNNLTKNNIVNYETMYFREDVFLMFAMLENHYKTRFVSTLDEITEMFFNNKVLTHSVTKQEIIQLLYQVVSNNIPIKNVYGYPCYLYENYNVYYLVDHIIPFPSSEDIFLAYYSKHPQLYVKTDSPESGKASGTNYYQSVTWFNNVLNDYYESLIPLAIKDLTTLSNSTNLVSKTQMISKQLISLPNDVQQRIIEMAVAARVLEIHCNVQNTLPPLPAQLSKEWIERNQNSVFCKKKTFRTIILDHYKNYYRIDGVDSFKMAIVWFLSDIVEERAKERCLYGSSLNLKSGYTARPLWNEWKICGKKERVRVEKERSLIKKQYETDLGYYGLWNPKNNEFCIRDIRNQTGKKDKRSIPSGKRCINWTKPALTELAAIAINIPIPNQSVLPTLEEAREEIKSNKELRNIVPKDNADNSLLIKLVFWYKLSRNDICINLREWFDRNNLLVEDNSCGVQTKRK